MIPYLLFGKSIFVTRAAAALLTLAAALFTALIFRNVFHSRFHWLPVMLLTVTPAWFLHSRTAFETSLAVSMFAGMLYFYLMYRTRSPGYLSAAVLLGALAFYSYSPARVVVAVTAGLLFFSDLGCHLQRRKTLLLAGLLLAALAFPIIRFLILHPGEGLQHLHQLNSYWIKDLPLAGKLGKYISQYLWGLSPLYWFSPSNPDMERHVMGPYGHQLLASLPFALAGFGLVLKKIARPEYRAVLIAFLAAPSGAALVEIGITRALFMVIPLAIFTALGMNLLLDWLIKKLSIGPAGLSMVFFLPLSIFTAWFTRDALLNGPTWHHDYSLYGMQYGAKQVFGAIKEQLGRNPGQPIVVSPSWTNGADTVARFFFDDPLPFEIASIEGYSERYIPFNEKTLFIMIPEEMEHIQGNEKFAEARVVRTLPYPDGKPGFFFVHLRYSPRAEEIFAREKEQRSILLEERVDVHGIPAMVRYSHLDMGEIGHIFDGDQDTVIRTLEANPLQVQVTFPDARMIKQVRLRIGGNPTLVSAEMLDQAGKAIQRVEQAYAETSDPRSIVLDTDSLPVHAIKLSITTLYSPEPGHVHLWEVEFLE